jgi:autotransporter adhesin
VAIGRGAVASKPGSVAIGSDSVANSINVVAVGAEGNERRIRHVAPGQQPTDAVNLGQLQSFVAVAVKADNDGVAIEQLRRQLAEMHTLVQLQQQRIAQLERQGNQ